MEFKSIFDVFCAFIFSLLVVVELRLLYTTTSIRLSCLLFFDSIGKFGLLAGCGGYHKLDRFKCGTFRQ